jgi:hypothetical protein
MPGDDAIQNLEYIYQRVGSKVTGILRKGAQRVKQHLAYMVGAKLVKRSGALLRSVQGAPVVITEIDGVINAEISAIGSLANARGQTVKQYLKTQLGTGSKTIVPTSKDFLAIPIMGGPAFRGNVPVFTPKSMPGIMMRFGQVLYAGKANKKQDLIPAFVLKQSVTVPARVNPQDAVDEAKPEILWDLRGMIQEVMR